MKNMYNKYYLFLILILLFPIFYGCSSDSNTKTKEANDTQVDTNVEKIGKTPKKELVTVKDTIEANLSEAMERLRYWDNSGLYENEFGYLLDETTFDEYLTFGQITFRNPSTVIGLVVDSLFMFEHDSAEVWVTIDLENPDGTLSSMSEQRLISYYHRGRWIKPTVSVMKNQAEYDELIRQAEEASQWEDE